ncbi:hypothetical protein [Deinococcus altitudinis]|uniref:hypothetical protein n=1 Tax=Deinococcus altitudinis TaxID=468914 RepID=UPI0038926F32
MVDPTVLIDSLYQHLQTRKSRPINNGPLQRQAVKPGAAEFALTAILDGPDSASGGTRMTWSVEGYIAVHHAADTLPTRLLLDAVQTASALNSWWHEPAPQNEPGLLSWTVNPSNMFVNPFTNSSGGTGVLTLETGFTLLLELEVT